MNIVEVSQIVGLVSFIMLLGMKFYILMDIEQFRKSGRIAGLWLWVYLFFLLIIRFFSFLHIATPDQLRVISGFSSLIPLVGSIINLYLNRKISVV